MSRISDIFGFLDKLLVQTVDADLLWLSRRVPSIHHAHAALAAIADQVIRERRRPFRYADDIIQLLRFLVRDDLDMFHHIRDALTMLAQIIRRRFPARNFAQWHFILSGKARLGVV